MAENIEKMEFPEDTERCQGIISNGQCTNKGMLLQSGARSHFCKIHGGPSCQLVEKKESLRNYQLTQFQAKFLRHATSPQIKDLRDEIAILRMMMETKLNQCNDDVDLMLQCGPISELAVKIEKIVGSCHKLEGSMAQLLDRQAILQFASEVIAIISDDVADTTVLERITQKMMAAIGRMGNDESIRSSDDL